MAGGGLTKYARGLADLDTWRALEGISERGQLPPGYDLEREDIKLCSPPATAWARARLPASIAIVPPEVTLCSASGRWGACDVYLSVPVTWVATSLTLSAKSENITVPLVTVALAAIPRVVRGTGANSRFVALPLSVRGRVCDEFIVTGTGIVGGGAEGYIRMEVWDCADQVPIDDIARATTPLPILSPDVQIDNSDQAFQISRIIPASVNASLLQMAGRSTAAADRFLYLFDAAAVPAPGTLPDRLPIRIAAGRHFALNPDPTLFATGIVWASSTTDAPVGLTLTGVADMWVDTYFRQ